MNPHHDPERTGDIMEELMQFCKKRRCVFKAGNGVFYLAKIVSDFPAEATAIAQVREINPGLAEWSVVEDKQEAKR